MGGESRRPEIPVFPATHPVPVFQGGRGVREGGRGGTLINVCSCGSGPPSDRISLPSLFLGRSSDALRRSPVPPPQTPSGPPQTGARESVRAGDGPILLSHAGVGLGFLNYFILSLIIHLILN